MSETSGDKGMSDAQSLVVHTPPASAPRRGVFTLLVALLALLLAGWSAWRSYRGERDRRADDALAQLAAQVDTMVQGSEQRRRDLDGLRARLSDADTVNKGLREELFSLGERLRHVEDAVAHLAEQRLSGRDALALNEAEFLLVQAQERLALFHDADAAITAYRLADAALAAAEDPAFASVRRTIGAEREALQAARPADLRVNFDAIEHVRAQLPGFSGAPVAVAAEPAAPSRWRDWLAPFVRVSHVDASGHVQRDPALAQALIALDLRDAQAALLAGDGARYGAALARARAGIAALPAPATPARQAALTELERLAAAPLAPALPELGSALKELRNLRTTRALATPLELAPASGGDRP